MQPKAITELTQEEKKEYHLKIDSIKHMVFDLEASLREGQDARHDLFNIRCELSKVQDWYFTKGP